MIKTRQSPERVSNPRSRPYTVCELSVELPWEDPQFYWLEDPHEGARALDEYAFSRQLSFPRTIVLNHRLLDWGRIPGYGFMKGLLLGRSFASIPESYRHCTEVRAAIHVVDQGDTDHTGDFSLWWTGAPRSNAASSRSANFPGCSDRAPVSILGSLATL
jgi:hypothetical protein